jgi:hypothetical protein
MAMNSTILTVLNEMANQLETQPNVVPDEPVIRALARVNALCAKNMTANDWFPHHTRDCRRKGK